MQAKEELMENKNELSPQDRMLPEKKAGEDRGAQGVSIKAPSSINNPATQRSHSARSLPAEKAQDGRFVSKYLPRLVSSPALNSQNNQDIINWIVEKRRRLISSQAEKEFKNPRREEKYPLKLRTEAVDLANKDPEKRPFQYHLSKLEAEKDKFYQDQDRLEAETKIDTELDGRLDGREGEGLKDGIDEARSIKLNEVVSLLRQLPKEERKIFLSKSKYKKEEKKEEIKEGIKIITTKIEEMGKKQDERGKKQDEFMNKVNERLENLENRIRELESEKAEALLAALKEFKGQLVVLVEEEIEKKLRKLEEKLAAEIQETKKTAELTEDRVKEAKEEAKEAVELSKFVYRTTTGKQDCPEPFFKNIIAKYTEKALAIWEEVKRQKAQIGSLNPVRLIKVVNNVLKEKFNLDISFGLSKIATNKIYKVFKELYETQKEMIVNFRIGVLQRTKDGWHLVTIRDVRFNAGKVEINIIESNVYGEGRDRWASLEEEFVIDELGGILLISESSDKDAIDKAGAENLTPEEEKIIEEIGGDTTEGIGTGTAGQGSGGTGTGATGSQGGGSTSGGASAGSPAGGSSAGAAGAGPPPKGYNAILVLMDIIAVQQWWGIILQHHQG